jgi:hypothetical protein
MPVSRIQRILAVALVVAAPLAAQSRAVNLTAKPMAELEEPFTQINGIRELPGNRAVVVDAQEKTLQMADFGKGSLTKISRNGSGPGEFQFPMSAFAGPANATWVADPMMQKIHVVSPDGKITSALLTPGGDGPGSLVFPQGVDAKGRLYFQGNGFTPGQTTASDTVPIIRWDPAIKRVDTVAWIPSGLITSVSGGGNRASFTMRMNPYSKADAWGVLPDGRVAIVRADPYRVDIVEAPGRVRKGAAVAYTPVKIGAAERDAYRKNQQSGGGAVMVTRAVGGTPLRSTGAAPSSGTTVTRGTPGVVADEDFPPVMPAFAARGVRTTPEGEIWVLRNRAASDKTPTYDIFDGTGKLVGKATLKPNSAIVGFGAGTAYVARQDPEDDLRYLEKYVR